jgi:hypothetical protein
MKTNLKYTTKLLAGFILLFIICCNKIDPVESFTAPVDPFKSDLPVEVFQPGIYKGPITILKNGESFSWLEFKTPGILDKVGLVIPLKELTDEFSFPFGKNDLGTLEITMPETRGNQIFDRIVLTYFARNQNSAPLNDPHINFNFYFNGSPSNCELDCETDHPLARMPLEYIPVPMFGGCIIGLGRLWMQSQKFYELHQAAIFLGSAKDDLAFYSPTASIEVLANHPDLGGEIPLPPVMTPSRYYPTYYHMRQIGDELHITLEKFRQKN